MGGGFYLDAFLVNARANKLQLSNVIDSFCDFQVSLSLFLSLSLADTLCKSVDLEKVTPQNTMELLVKSVKY